MTSIEIPRYTDAYLVEQIKDTWKDYKDENHPISGDYYYDEIISGVYHNKPIYITQTHFPSDLRIQLEQFSDKEKYKIITRSIIEFFGYVQGKDRMQQAVIEKRFHWRWQK